MQKVQSLEFQCLACKKPVPFSLFQLEGNAPICCSFCEKKYAFTDPVFIRQIQKFQALCRQIRESEEILGHAYVGVDCGDRQTKVPYKILLCRLKSSLDLKIGDQPFSITFRTEPLQEHPKAHL